MRTLVFLPPGGDMKPHFLQRSDDGSLMVVKPGEPFPATDSVAAFFLGPEGNACIHEVVNGQPVPRCAQCRTSQDVAHVPQARGMRQTAIEEEGELRFEAEEIVGMHLCPTCAASRPGTQVASPQAETPWDHDERIAQTEDETGDEETPDPLAGVNPDVAAWVREHGIPSQAEAYIRQLMSQAHEQIDAHAEAIPLESAPSDVEPETEKPIEP